MEDSPNIESDGEQDVDDRKDLPVVFQCHGCSAILSDSEAFVAANNDLKSITLSRITSAVGLSAKLVTSTEGIDQGSTYTPLICDGCKAKVGKIYRTTPRALDDLRDAYTFDVNSLSIYQVGSASVSLTSDSDSFLDSHTSLKTLKETTLKLQVLMCAMHQRIANIEQSLEIEETELTGLVADPIMGLRKSKHAIDGASTTTSSAGHAKQRQKPSQNNDNDELAKQSGQSVARRRDQQRRDHGGNAVHPKKQKSDHTGHLPVDSPLSSDSESSMSNVGEIMNCKGQESVSNVQRGKQGGGTSSAVAQPRGLKRAKASRNNVGNGVELMDADLELLSPIRKKMYARSNKS